MHGMQCIHSLTRTTLVATAGLAACSTHHGTAGATSSIYQPCSMSSSTAGMQPTQWHQQDLQIAHQTPQTERHSISTGYSAAGAAAFRHNNVPALCSRLHQVFVLSTSGLHTSRRTSSRSLHTSRHISAIGHGNGAAAADGSTSDHHSSSKSADSGGAKSQDTELDPAAALKQALRELYKQVHPDLFQMHPAEKADNERSLKLLQDYLSQARVKIGETRGDRPGYSFVFHMRRTAADPSSPVDSVSASGSVSTVDGQAMTGSPSAPSSHTAKSTAHGGSSSSISGISANLPDPSAYVGNPQSAASGKPLTAPPVGAATGSPSSGSFQESDSASVTESDSAGSEPSAASLHRVELFLPPPIPHLARFRDRLSKSSSAADDDDGDDAGVGGSAGSGAPLSLSTRKALSKLFDACGLSENLIAALGGVAKGVGSGATGARRLSEFLPEAMEALRQAEASRPVDPAVRVANLRGALRMGRQVLASFSDRNLPPAVQATHLHTLVSLLDANPTVDVRGCHILIGNRHGLDRLGQLCLDIEEPPMSWLDFLSQVDVEFARERKKTAEATKSLEKAVAASIGLASVYTFASHILEPPYQACLQRLAAAGSSLGKIGSGRWSNLSLCIVPAGQEHTEDESGSTADVGSAGGGSKGGSRQASSGCSIDDNFGFVRAPAEVQPEQLYAFIEQHGGKAASLMAARQAKEAELGQLTERVRRTFRLRRLMRDPQLEPAHFTKACMRLLDERNALMHIMESNSLRIGFTNRLTPGGDAVEIAWDFHW